MQKEMDTMTKQARRALNLLENGVAFGVPEQLIEELCKSGHAAGKAMRDNKPLNEVVELLRK